MLEESLHLLEKLTKNENDSKVEEDLKNFQIDDKEWSERKFFRRKNLPAVFSEKVPIVSKMIHVEYHDHISKNHRCNITVPSIIKKI